MVSKQIIDTDAFLEMSISAQALYFHLVIRADDDGFVPNAKRTMRMINVNEDDFKILLSKRFILIFDSGVVVIKHWLLHNAVRKDMYKETQYIEEKNELKVKENKVYTEKRNEVVTNPLHRLGEVRIEEDRLGKTILVEEFKLASLLRDLIKENTPTFKEPNLQDWTDEVDKMVRLDKRTYEQIEIVIRWSQNDDFWQSNILSTKKLRKNFDMLVSKIKAGSQSQTVKI